MLFPVVKRELEHQAELEEAAIADKPEVLVELICVSQHTPRASLLRDELKISWADSKKESIAIAIDCLQPSLHFFLRIIKSIGTDF